MVSFSFSFQPGMTLQQMIGFEIAGRVWGAYLTDNATVNVHVGGSDSLANSVLGGALPSFKTGVSFGGDLRNQMTADAKSSDDAVIKQSFEQGRGLNAVYEHRPNGTVSTVSKSGSTVSLTQANAKALGVTLNSTSSALDGYITFSNQVKDKQGNSIPWNYNYTSTSVPTNTVDFVTTAIHEIGHILGFVSAVDRVWEVSPTVTDYNLFNNSLDERINETSLLDVFRTGRDTNNSAFTGLAVGGTRFLSLRNDYQASELGYFATGKDSSMGGNGFQASHWRGDAGSSGMMNAGLGKGQRGSLTTLDLRAFDILGWDLVSTGANTTLNWSTLQSEAKQALANRIGKTVTWIDANSTAAADLLDQDRLNDVNLMLSNSADIYEGRTNKTTGTWQELFSLLDEQGLLDALEKTSSDSAKATARNDLLAGSTTDDELAGLRGNDRLIGFKGNDTLCGNKGTDLLLGSLGQDVLIGGKGNDSLIGGAGADIFAVQRHGFDVVEDFTDGEDKLLLLGGLQFEQLGIEQKGQDTLISYEGNSLMLLKNLDTTGLTMSDLTSSV